MSNENMKANRFLRMYENKKLYNGIIAEIAKGLSIQITTYTQSKIYSKAEQFKLGKTGVYAQRGKNWDCINGSSIRSVRI
jgi:hypothetical protein